MKICRDVTEMIGHTPLVALDRICAAEGIRARILAKVESCEPTGSAKDRAALEMILTAEAEGQLKPGSTIIEPTSGNTGIGLASLATVRGYRAVIVMPDTMSAERIALMKAYGADVVLTPGAQGMKGSIARARQLAEEIPGSFIPGQFDNPANAMAHYRTTGPEIWQDTDGKIDAFVAGVGTGGTLTGTGRFLKEQNAEIKIVAAEPAGSPLLTGGQAGSHRIEGIGANFIPTVLDQNLPDEVVDVPDDAAFACARQLARREGLFVGVSSGAALYAALQLGRRNEFAGKNIVVLLPDSGSRYLSVPEIIQD